MSFVSAYIYLSAAKADNAEQRLSAEVVWGIMSISWALCMVSLVVFLSKIRREFIATFFSRVTGKDFSCRCFLDATSDAARVKVFSRHPSYYADIKENVAKWLEEGWESWLEDPPPWFTARFVAKIPDDMLPPEALKVLNRAGRRKSSMFAVAIGAQQVAALAPSTSETEAPRVE
jgi:hypothetical protein